MTAESVDYAAERYEENPRILYDKINAMNVDDARAALRMVAATCFNAIGDGWSTVGCFDVLDRIDDGKRAKTWDEP